MKRAGFQHRECRAFSLCVNFLKTFKPFCQQGQRQMDSGDEAAERWPEEGWAKSWAESFLRPSLDFQTLVSGGWKDQDLGGT